MGVLADVAVALDVHRGMLEVAGNGLGFLMCLAAACVGWFVLLGQFKLEGWVSLLNGLNGVQVALMGAVPSAVAAVDAHRRIAEVARAGLGFLQNLASAPENQVMP